MVKGSMCIFALLCAAACLGIPTGSLIRYVKNTPTILSAVTTHVNRYSGKEYVFYNGARTLLKTADLQKSSTELSQSMTTHLGNKKSSFLFGASTSEHQCGTKCTPQPGQKHFCSYARFAQKKKLPKQTDGLFHMNLWDNYKAYMDYLKDTLGLNSMRFSIEWALIQKDGPDSWDQSVVNHYADMFVYALQKGITPVICFHHYTDPCWFIDAGGFEQDENTAKRMDQFAQYCTRVYEALITAAQKNNKARAALQNMMNNNRTPLWATFNSPAGYAFKCYYKLEGEPGTKEKSGLVVTSHVLKNMMEAHVQTYKKIHASNASSISPRVGFLKNVHQLDPPRKKFWHKAAAPLMKYICGFGNMIQSQGIYGFFKTGTFNITIGSETVKHTNKDACRSLDFIGLNYYSNRYMGAKESNPALQSNNKHYRIYPEGIYRALLELADEIAIPVGKTKSGKPLPIYVTENGVATNNSNKRNAFYQSYLNALDHGIEKLKQKECDVLGYLTWTLADNYEWPKLSNGKNAYENCDPRVYGLCGVNPSNPAELQVKKGAQFYHELAHAFFGTSLPRVTYLDDTESVARRTVKHANTKSTYAPVHAPA